MTPPRPPRRPPKTGTTNPPSPDSSDTPNVETPPAPPVDPIAEILEKMPDQPGVYLMKDRRGKIIYIGKAACLRDRVRQYFHSSSDNRDFVPLLGGLLGDIETLVTRNEKEALLLENNLIKQHQPKFNVKLVDDKNYLVLRLDTKAEWPRLEVVRKIEEDGARYFGPYHSATACRETLRVVNRHFKLRTCTDHVLYSRKRPCLQFQIKRCDAPCVFPISKAVYGEQVDDVTFFLQGRDDELLSRLRGRMKEASSKLAYEVAATLRDQIAALEKTLEQQRVVGTTFVDQDVVGFYREGTNVEIVMLFVRQGKLLGQRGFSFKNQEFPDSELLASFLSQFYEQAKQIPEEVLLPDDIAGIEVVSEFLTERRGSRSQVMVPKRGGKRDLVALAVTNAKATFVHRRDRKADAEESLAKLQRRIRSQKLPRRIECYDIAHFQGQVTLGSMVVFVDGEPDKSAYRLFRMKSVTGPDDYRSLYEMISRRFRRAREKDAKWPMPDLVVIDGGKGQLGSTMAALHDLGVDTGAQGLAVIALAKESENVAGEKRPDRVFLPNAKDPLKVRPGSAELYLLMRLRDEAHRFANSHHRRQLRKSTLRSGLNDIPGIGDQRRKALLRHFMSLKKIREASVAELAAVESMTTSAAEKVHHYFHGPGQVEVAPAAAAGGAGASEAMPEEMAEPSGASMAAPGPVPSDDPGQSASADSEEVDENVEGDFDAFGENDDTGDADTVPEADVDEAQVIDVELAPETDLVGLGKTDRPGFSGSDSEGATGPNKRNN